MARSRDQHDSLHLDNGQECACMCQRCFKSWMTISNKRQQEPKLVGKCICSLCPCERNTRMYVIQEMARREEEKASA